MLEALETRNKVVGLKQLKKALREGTAATVFVAKDADPRVTEPIYTACREGNIPLEECESMSRLGKACGIEVGAAVAAVLR